VSDHSEVPESERWKDRVEVSLDGRQIFFLFFGSAVAACLIFVAGVLVGKRIEQHAIASAPPVAEDPLQVLDQIDQAELNGGEITFQDVLAREQRRREERAPERPAQAARPAANPNPPSAPAANPSAPSAPVALPRLPTQEKKTGHFALCVASFSDRTKPEAFAERIRAAGFHPTVVQSEVPGKGTVYRVLVGDYGTRQAAEAAMADYNKKQPGFSFVVSQ
jgi:cell division septation protein DedD